MSDAVASEAIRAATPADIDEVAALWCEAFPGKRTAADRARALEAGGRYGGLETVLVARDGGALVGACKIYPMTQHIAGGAMPMMGLAAVAVAPGARRQGLGARLCVRAMEMACSRGDVISTLYPFRPDYYERLGWGLVGELHEYRLRTASLPRYDEARHVRVARDPGDGDAIAACYSRVAARSNGPIARDARIWAYRLAGEEIGAGPVSPVGGPGARPDPRPGRGMDVGGGGGRDRVVVYDRDGVGGYALLRRRPGAGPEAREIQVRELVAESEEAYRGLLGHLAGMAERWPVARHTARVEERLGDRLNDPRPHGGQRARSLYFPTARIIRGPMMRILDAPRALALRPYFDARHHDTPSMTTIEVRIDDPQLPENRGPWSVRITPDEVSVTAAEGGPADGRIATDAPTIARVFAGDIAPVEAAGLGRARLAGDVALLDAAFATRERCWLLDEF